MARFSVSVTYVAKLAVLDVANVEQWLIFSLMVQKLDHIKSSMMIHVRTFFVHHCSYNSCHAWRSWISGIKKQQLFGSKLRGTQLAKVSFQQQQMCCFQADPTLVRQTWLKNSILNPSKNDFKSSKINALQLIKIWILRSKKKLEFIFEWQNTTCDVQANFEDHYYCYYYSKALMHYDSLTL